MVGTGLSPILGGHVGLPLRETILNSVSAYIGTGAYRMLDVVRPYGLFMGSARQAGVAATYAA